MLCICVSDIAASPAQRWQNNRSVLIVYSCTNISMFFVKKIWILLLNLNLNNSYLYLLACTLLYGGHTGASDTVPSTQMHTLHTSTKSTFAFCTRPELTLVNRPELNSCTYESFYRNENKWINSEPIHK